MENKYEWKKNDDLSRSEQAAFDGFVTAQEEMRAHKYANPLLNEREKTHGDYAQVAACSQALKVVLREYGTRLKPAEVNESLELICMKMARLVCGDYAHRDSWDDIIGYAELARGVCRE